MFIIDDIAVLCGNIDVVAVLFEPDAEPTEAFWYYAEVFITHVFDGYGTSGYCRHAYEAADFDHVGENAV